MLFLHRTLAVVEIQDDLFVQFVVVVAVAHELVNESLEHGDVVLVTIDLDGTAPGSETQFGIERFQQQDVAVVHAVEDDRVGLFQKDYFLNHAAKIRIFFEITKFSRENFPETGISALFIPKTDLLDGEVRFLKS